MAQPKTTPLHRMSEDEARAFLERIRWPEGPACVHCGSVQVTRLEGKATRPGVFKCREKGCRRQFTVTVGTIFHGSHIQLRDWVYAFASMCGSKKGISALQLKRELGLQYRSAWFLCHRIREAMKADPLRGMLRGVVEMDETYVGGKPRLTPEARRQLKRKGQHVPWTDKVPVVALVQRDGEIRTRAIADVKPGSLKAAIYEMAEGVDPSATLNTDQHKMYRAIGRRFASHRVVNHPAREYFRHSDQAGINTAECFFGLLKRGIHGAFHHVSKRHLQRYCDEFSFRWNHRKVTDHERTIAAIRGAEGKRLSYCAPTR